MTNIINTIAKNATAAASTLVSENYSFISTQQAHAVLADFGFTESRYKQRAVKGVQSGHQAHISIFDRAKDADNEGGFNLLLLNSHDGSTALRLEAGYFRILCENQLGAGDVGTRIIHRGDVLDKFVQAVPLVLAQMETFKEIKGLLQDKTLSMDAQLELAKLALQLREVKADSLDSFQLERNLYRILARRRQADTGNNAWRVFNAVQENVIKGGVRLYQNKGTVEEPKDVLRLLRPLTSMERIVDTNNALTEFTVQLARAA